MEKNNQSSKEKVVEMEAELYRNTNEVRVFEQEISSLKREK
jgi:hypothetical protein